MPAPSITVYSKPHCVQCDAAKRALNKADVAYDAVDITQNTDALAKVKALGHAQAPVIVWVDRHGDVHHRSGFAPDFVKAAIADLTTLPA